MNCPCAHFFLLSRFSTLARHFLSLSLLHFSVCRFFFLSLSTFSSSAVLSPLSLHPLFLSFTLTLSCLAPRSLILFDNAARSLSRSFTFVLFAFGFLPAFLSPHHAFTPLIVCASACAMLHHCSFRWIECSHSSSLQSSTRLQASGVGSGPMRDSSAARAC